MSHTETLTWTEARNRTFTARSPLGHRYAASPYQGDRTLLQVQAARRRLPFTVPGLDDPYVTLGDFPTLAEAQSYAESHANGEVPTPEQWTTDTRVEWRTQQRHVAPDGTETWDYPRDTRFSTVGATEDPAFHTGHSLAADFRGNPNLRIVEVVVHEHVRVLDFPDPILPQPQPERTQA